MADLPARGSIVKIFDWHGKVLRRLKGDDGDGVIEVHFIKNIYKRQNPEFLPMRGLDIEPATLEDAMKEAAYYQEVAERRLEEWRGE